MPHDVLLFDLDGTLSDPLEGIEKSINYALVENKFPPITPRQAAAFIGPPLDQTFSLITGIGAGERLNGFVAKYRERYADVGYTENVLYPGVRDALVALSTNSSLKLSVNCVRALDHGRECRDKRR